MTEPRQAPYPADTLAKGWRFEVDMEKVKRSDTWLRAKTGEVRGALLLLWGESWGQTPCGTLPNDEELIALLIDMPPAKFAKHRGVLMRGWWLADDGRLYHDTVAERVLEMIAARKKERDRKNGWRQRQEAGRAEASGGSPPVVPRDTHVADDTGTSTRTGTGTSSLRSEDPPKPPRKRRGDAAAQLLGVDELVAEGVSPQHAKDWLAARREKKLPLTQTAWDDVKAEAALAKLTLDEAVKTAAVKGWGGFKAKWLAQEAAADAAKATGHGAPVSDWWESKTGLLDRGLQLGIPAPADEGASTWAHFKAAVWVAAGDGAWWDKTSVAYPIAVRLRDKGNELASSVLAGMAKGVPHAG